MKSQTISNVLLKNSIPITSIKSLMQGYILNCHCEGKSQDTIKNYQYRINCFLWYCQENGYPDEPESITSSHIRQFLWYLSTESNRWGNSSTSARKPASQATVNHYYRVLSGFFGWLHREELIRDNPISHIKAPRLENKVVEALTPEGVKALLKQCSAKTFLDIRNRAILMMFLDTGLRVSELANLRLDDVDMKTGSILIRKGKGGKQRIVRIGNKAQKALWRYVTLYRRGNSESLFLNKSGEVVGVRGIKLTICRIGKNAGIEGVHVHRLRHTFAISFLRAGGDVFSLRYLLGHSTLQMTQRYLQSLNADDAMKAHKRFSPLDNMDVKSY